VIPPDNLEERYTIEKPEDPSIDDSSDSATEETAGSETDESTGASEEDATDASDDLPVDETVPAAADNTAEPPAATTSESAAGTQSTEAAPPADDDHAGHDHAAEHGHTCTDPNCTHNHAQDEEAACTDPGCTDPNCPHAHQDGAEDCGADDHGEPGHVCGEGCSHGLNVSAILVCTDRDEPGIKREVARQINLSSIAQAVEPAAEIQTFFKGVVGNIQLVLLVLAVITVIVASLGIMVSIYNSMSDRRHEIAIMRALGASRSTVMIVILLESILLSLGGGLIGLLLGHGLIGALSSTIESSTGVIVSAFHFQVTELILIPGLIALASMVGYLPALVAYRTDVARSLTQNP